jgi:hypothetical protein
VTTAVTLANTSNFQVGYATTAGFAVTFNTNTLVTTAVTLANTSTTQVGYATTAGFAVTFNTNTLVTTAVTLANTSNFQVGYATTAGFAVTFNTNTLVTTAVTLANTSTTQVGYATTAGFAVTFNTNTLVTTAVTLANTSTTQVGFATTASNLSGGSTGSLPYQSSTGTTAMLSIATTSGYVLSNTGNVPQWTSPSGLSAGSATNINGGLANEIPYQLSPGVTTFSSNLLFNGSTFTTTNMILTGNIAGSTSTYAQGTLQVAGGAGIAGSLFVGQNTVFNGSVTFNGTATYIFSTNTFYTDNIIELHLPPGGVGSQWQSDDGKDIGLRFHYYNRTLSTDTNAALVLADDSQQLEFYITGSEDVHGDFTGTVTYGAFKTGVIILTSSTNATSTATGALQMAGGIGATNIWLSGNTQVASSTTVNQQTIVVNANGIGVTGDSYFANNLGIGNGLNVKNNITATNVYANIYANNTATIQVGYATTAGYAVSFNTNTLVTTAVTLANTSTLQVGYATTAGFAVTFNTNTLVTTAVTLANTSNFQVGYATTAGFAVTFNTNTLVTTAVTLANTSNFQVGYATTAGFAVTFNTNTLVTTAVTLANTSNFQVGYATTAGFAVTFNTNTLVTTAVTLANTSNFQVGYATTAGFAVTFNTNTLVTTAVTLANTSTTQVGYATTAGFAVTFNTNTLVTTAVTLANTSAVLVSYAVNASLINSVSQSSNNNYYPTFVLTNNTTATAMALYTTSNFYINPSTDNVSIGGTITGQISGSSNGTAFLAGTGAYNGIALGMQVANGPANMAIRDLSNVSSIMYFDASANAAYGGEFRWRTSNAFNQLMVLTTLTNTINVPTSITNNSASNSTQSGSLVVTGGAGIGQNLNVGGNIITTGTIQHSGLITTYGTNIDQIYNTSTVLTLSTNWQSTGIMGSQLPTGSYMIQCLANDSAQGGGEVNTYYTGVMSWYSSTDSDASFDEITLHRAGAASGAGIIFLQVQRNNGGVMSLQIAGTTNNSSTSTYSFSFRRMI